MLNLLRLILCFISLTFVGAIPQNFALEAQQSPQSELSSSEPVTVQLISETESLQPGKPTWVAIHMSIAKNWHAYWKNPGDAGMAPMVTWNLPEGFTADQLQWPTPKRFDLSSAIGFGYEDEIILLTQITAPASFNQSSPVKISADIRWVVCDDSTCLPGEATIDLSLPVSSNTPQLNNRSSDLFTKARAQIPEKHTSATAQRKQDCIELTLLDPNSEPLSFKDAQFFPEEKKSIDYKKAITIQHSSDDLTQHTLSLKEIDSSSTPSSNLKGILVLNTNTSSPKSFEIDIPIDTSEEANTNTNSNEIAYAVGNRAAAYADAPPANDFEFQGGVALAIAFAFLGGMILNLMPCVLPVISLKILSFVKLAGESRKLIFQHGLAFALGVLLSFWTLAGVLLALQAYGRSVGWGFQLQEPIFVAALAAVLLVFSLSLFGLFEMGTSMISMASQTQPNKNKGLLSSLLSGILATAVATPCTGPFLGSAVGFAVTLPAPLALLIFTSLGLGMSLPYLVLAAFPSLLRFLPRAGNWMIAFKELMGFFMLATVLWLIWIFGAQTNSFAISILLAGFFFMAIACWIYGRWATPLQKKLTRTIGLLAASCFFALGAYAVVMSSSSWADAMGGGSSVSTNVASAEGEWEEFSAERVAELRKKGIPVFIDFTAKWCLICQANHLVLTVDEVNQKFNEKGVVKMKADWTKNDSAIAAELRKFGRNSVPLYVLYGTDSTEKPQILPQVLTPETVTESLNHIGN